jgi:hypothetical protein
LMPLVRLARAAQVACEHFEHDKRVDGVRLLPAIRHAAAVGAVGVDEDDWPSVDPKEVRVVSVVVTNVD